MVPGVTYLGVEEGGLRISTAEGEQLLAVDNVVVCAGQEPLREVAEAMGPDGPPVSLVGGADEAGELDAKRAIAQATRLAGAL